MDHFSNFPKRVHVLTDDDHGPNFRKIIRQCYNFSAIYADLKTNLRYYGNRTNTLNNANIANVNIKMSLFTSLREIVGKYVMICNQTT